MVYLLIGYMWLFIHRPFEVWLWIGDFRVERVYMLITLGYWACCAEKAWNSNRTNLAIFVFAAALLLSNALSPFTEFFDLTIQNWLKIAVFYVLIISTIKSKEDLKKIVIAFLVISALYMVHSLREYLCGRHVYRMGIARMVGVDSSLGDPNSFGASIVYALPIMIPVWNICRTKTQKLGVVGYAMLSTGCVLLTGSRTAFMGLIAFIGALTLASKYRWRAIAGLLVVAPIVWALTSQDLQNRYLTIVDQSKGPANAQESAESRWDFFVIATELFERYPITGVGPQGFPKASGTNMSVHSIYGQLVGELGIVGILAFLLLLGTYFLNTRETWQLSRAGAADDDGFLPAVSYAVALSVMLLLLLGFGGHNLLRFTWLWFGAFQAIAVTMMRRRNDLSRHVDDVEYWPAPALSPQT